MDAAAFLHQLFADSVGELGDVVIFDARSKVAAWSSSIDEAARVATAAAVTADVYFGAALQDRAEALAIGRAEDRAAGKPERALTGTRGFSRTARVLPGIFADVDVAGPAHKKAGLAPSVDAIRSRLARLPAAPTIVVATGGGLHLWWLFREPLDLDGPDERLRLEARLRGWQRFLESTIGYTVDPTSDLARVMRLPGLPNHKHGGLLSSVLSSDGPRFNPSDFEPWERASSTSAATVDTTMLDGIVLSPDACPDLGRIMALAGLDAKFLATWSRQRKDLASQSEYDMSLASYAARYGWTDQEIVNLCIAHRRDAGEKEKLRPSYFRLLLGKVRRDPEKDGARERLEARTVELEVKGHTGDVPRADDVREETLVDLSKALGIPIRRIVRFRGDPPSYRLDLEDASISLPTVSSILSPVAFEEAIAAGAGKVIGTYKRAEWKPLAQAILRACVDEDLGADSDPAALAAELLGGFLGQHTPYREEERAKALEQRRPWLQDGDVWFWLGEIVSWISMRGGERTTRKGFARALRKLGARPHHVRVMRGRSASTAQVWRMEESSALRLIGPEEVAEAVR